MDLLGRIDKWQAGDYDCADQVQRYRKNARRGRRLATTAATGASVTQPTI